jgi:hypothetical protein
MQVEHMRHRLNAGRIELVKLFDVPENVIHLPRETLFLFVREAEARQRSDIADLFS